MEIKSLEIKNFRNYESLEIQLNNRLTVIFGDNAQGKTNILEAIYVLAIGKSYRTEKENEIIKFNEQYSRLFMKYTDDNADKEKTIEYYLDKNNKKQIKDNSFSVKRMSDHIGIVKLVVFSPQSMDIVKGAPSKRRKYLDILLSQISKTYLYNLQQYNKYLKIKNSMLKQEKKDIDLTYLDIIDEQLAKYSFCIITERKRVVDDIKQHSEKIHQKLTCKKEKIDIEYKSDFSNMKSEQILSVFKNTRKNDIFRKISTKGIQKDDLDIKINELNVDTYGSQGQNRTALLTLKLAEFEVLIDAKEDKPILLLDDVLSELDNERINYLLQYVSKYQTIITTTDIAILKNIEASFIKIENGKKVK
ncbi:MAG: DNA replication/repair protein RecF [Clostridia bacterium]